MDYKDGQGFAKHMEKANVAVSEFAKTKTIAEQRRFLPGTRTSRNIIVISRQRHNPPTLVTPSLLLRAAALA